MNVIKSASAFLVVITMSAYSFQSLGQTAKNENAEEYVCSPCGMDCDKKIFHEPGKCPNCGSQLVKKSSIGEDWVNQSFSPIAIAAADQLKAVETSILNLAGQMPEDKYDFTPESLNINGSAFTGTRTFAQQIKHLATDNILIWSPITGDPVRADITDVNGPASVKSKAEVMNYLKESFAEGHKAIASLTNANANDLISFRGSKLSKLELAFYAIIHDNDHYGQMVEYLRMVGIEPGSKRK